MNRLLPKILGICILLGSFIAGWLLMDVQDFLGSPQLKNSEPFDYTIEPGTSLKHLVRDLENDNVINHPSYLVWYARWHGVANRIQAGEYEFMPAIKPDEFLDQIVTGRVKQYSLTLIEGWSFDQLMAAVNQSGMLEHTLAGLDPEAIMARLGWPDQHPEGRFFPDTYRITRGMTDVAFLQRAHEAMEERLAQEWQQRDENLPYNSPYEALIMASIIEKETAVAEERGQIAGVFVRRLQKHMRLQTDPTVIYGLGDRFDGNLTRRDLKLFTPYNTYLNNGLPPTPIAMPGEASIYAALHPEPGDALYFVARGDGTHHFSASVEEHNRAVAKYQLGKQVQTMSSIPSDEDSQN
jgi:UPF0755 protein